MVFQGKIPDETRAFVRIAKKYRGMRQSEIMERCGVSRSMVYRILKGVNTMQRSRATQKEISRKTSEIERPSGTSPFKADQHFTRGRREFHRKKVNGKSGFEHEGSFLSHRATVPSFTWLSLLE